MSTTISHVACCENDFRFQHTHEKRYTAAEQAPLGLSGKLQRRVRLFFKCGRYPINPSRKAPPAPCHKSRVASFPVCTRQCHAGMSKKEQGIIPLRRPLCRVVSESVSMYYLDSGLTPSQFLSRPWFVLERAHGNDLRARFRPVPVPLRHRHSPAGNELSPYQGMPRHCHNSVLTLPTQL